MDKFKSPKLLLKQARSQIDEIEGLISGFFNDCEVVQYIEIEDHTGNKVFKARLSEDAVPDKVNYLASSVINDLRHSLDQAACAAILAITEKPAGKIYFPIVDSITDLNGRLNKDFPEPIHETIRSIAPYPTGNEVLCLVAKTANDKHTSICELNGRVAGFYLNGEMTEVVRFTDPQWDYAKNEVLLCITGPTGEFNCTVTISPQMIFNQTRSIDGKPVVPFLRTALEAFEAAVSSIESASS